MPRSLRPIPLFFILGILLAGATSAQSLPAARLRNSVADSVIRVRNISIEHTEGGLAVAIASNGALVPTITKLDGPPRLVIDLAGAVNSIPRARVNSTDAEIRSIRVSQYQQNPPLTRVVIELAQIREYAWETVQNKLLVHLRRADDSNPVSAPAPAFTTETEPVAYAGNGFGTGVQEVNQQASGPSAVTASEQTTILNLTRGGNIRVCPGTTISVTSSGDKRDVMVGMSTGSFEAHYTINDSEDSVLTPDFRILLPGPGKFDLAISADSHGNTCVRGLPGNRTSAVVSELMGDGVYEVKANEQVVFHNGQTAKVDHNVPIDCGCPAEQVPILRAEAPPVSPPVETARPTELAASTGDPMAPGGQPNRGVAVKMAVTTSEVAAATPRKPHEIHLQVDAPLIFRGNEPLPAPTEEAQKLPVTLVRPEPLVLVPLPPSSAATLPRPAAAKPHTGFFGRFKRLLSSVFG